MNVGPTVGYSNICFPADILTWRFRYLKPLKNKLNLRSKNVCLDSRLNLSYLTILKLPSLKFAMHLTTYPDRKGSGIRYPPLLRIDIANAQQPSKVSSECRFACVWTPAT